VCIYTRFKQEFLFRPRSDDELTPHPKEYDLSKSPAVTGFFVCGMISRFVVV
jgi:hypothetical protein